MPECFPICEQGILSFSNCIDFVIASVFLPVVCEDSFRLDVGKERTTLKLRLFSLSFQQLTTLKCGICCRHFDSRTTPRFLTRNPIVEAKGRCLVDGRGFEQQFNWFCSDICFATHLLRKRSIEQCPRCLVKKYNVDMIRKPTGKVVTPSRGAPELEVRNGPFHVHESPC